MSQKQNQKIQIIDCDYLYNTSKVPNYKAMKLSSYHKQLGDSVNFITDTYQITGNHDVLYLIREVRHTPIPPGDLLDDYRTILIGKEFEIFEDSQDIPVEAAICRPDYTLYTYKEHNFYTDSNFVQFFQEGKLLKNVQDWHKHKGRSTVIVDPNFWDVPPQIIVDCLESIKFEPNIIFLAPIKLKKLINEQVYTTFLKLKLAKFFKIRYNNNIGEDFESVVSAIDVMKKLKTKYSYLNIGSIPIKIITTDHWANNDNIMYDFERCLKIMNYAQRQEVRISFKYPKLRLISPSWMYFEFFRTWSNHYHTLSYVEAITKHSTIFYKSSYADILNNSMHWNTSKIKQLVYLLATQTELMKKYAFTGWRGVESQTERLINYDYVKEQAFENNIL